MMIMFWGFHNNSFFNLVIFYINFYIYLTTDVKKIVLVWNQYWYNVQSWWAGARPPIEGQISSVHIVKLTTRDHCDEKPYSDKRPQ